MATVQTATAFFQSLLAAAPALQQPNLAVFHPGVPALDFNLSTHLPAGAVRISFLTDDLSAVEKQLQENKIDYTGPQASHLASSVFAFKPAMDFRLW